MINILGEDTLPSEILTMPNCHIHWYGKGKRSGRKMGHINVCAESPEALQKELFKLSNILDSEAFRALS